MTAETRQREAREAMEAREASEVSEASVADAIAKRAAQAELALAELAESHARLAESAPGAVQVLKRFRLGSPSQNDVSKVEELSDNGAWLCRKAKLPSQNTTWTCGYENLAALYKTLVLAEMWPTVPREVRNGR